MTARDWIEASLRLIGVLGSGETATANDASDALVVAVDLLDSWSADGMPIFKRTREEFDLVPNQSTYTIGTGGDFDTNRPIEIVRAGIKQNDLEMPVRILIEQEYANLSLKNTQSTLPCYLYYDGSFPLNNLILYPVPSAAHKLVLYSRKPLTTPLTLDDEIEMPQGYNRALRYNLAIDLAPEFGKSVSAEVASIANDSLATIKRNNTEVPLMRSDAAGLTKKSCFNIFKGDYE